MSADFGRENRLVPLASLECEVADMLPCAGDVGSRRLST